MLAVLAKRWSDASDAIKAMRENFAWVAASAKTLAVAMLAE